MDKLQLGYMAGFRGDLITEINFAKQHFDFIEITISPEVLSKIDNIFAELKEAVKGVEIVGHLHWHIVDMDEIKNNIEVLKSLGTRKITIHPFNDKDIAENIDMLRKIADYCTKQGLLLMVENVSDGKYSQQNMISTILNFLLHMGFTLDIGHANINDELDLFVSELGDKITHIHLHDNVGRKDHLFYTSEIELNEALKQIKSWGYHGTVLLETFAATPDEDKTFRRDYGGIMKLHLDQLEKIEK